MMIFVEKDVFKLFCSTFATHKGTEQLLEVEKGKFHYSQKVSKRFKFCVCELGLKCKPT